MLMWIHKIKSKMHQDFLLTMRREISTLLARSFFMKFSLTTLAVLARVRVLVQQMLLDAVLLYNTVSSISQREQTVKLNQEGFEVFREYYPTKEGDSIVLECIWQTDKYLLVERKHKSEANSQEKDVPGDVSLSASKIQYENIEVLLGVDESGTAMVAEHGPADPINVEENGGNSEMKNDEKLVQNASNATKPSSETKDKKSVEDGSCIIGSSKSPPSCPVKLKSETKKRVAFVSVKPPAPSTMNESRSFDLKGTEKNEEDKDDDPFFNLLSSKKGRLF